MSKSFDDYPFRVDMAMFGPTRPVDGGTVFKREAGLMPVAVTPEQIAGPLIDAELSIADAAPATEEVDVNRIV